MAKIGKKGGKDRCLDRFTPQTPYFPYILRVGGCANSKGLVHSSLEAGLETLYHGVMQRVQDLPQTARSSWNPADSASEAHAEQREVQS
eukprot:5442260-Amphidinium_carterae.1